MTDKDTETRVTRRSVLRQGAFAAGAVAIGTVGLSGTAAATICPRTPGFWANHDWCSVPNGGGSTVGESLSGIDCSDPSSEYTLPQTGVSKTMEEWQAFLLKPTRGDKAVKLAQTLLATKLNFELRSSKDSGPEDEQDCVYQATDFSDYGIDLRDYGFDENNVAKVSALADSWLEHSNFPGEQRDWTVVRAGKPVDGEALKDILDDFNNGALGLDCECGGETDSDDEKREKENGNGGPPGHAGPPNDKEGGPPGHAGPPEDKGEGPPVHAGPK
ncbi:hypothetical protein [Haloarcula pelagica]|uniref:hypothetical protein n=1 Tax=Haloarcula pelagica TaxID=3033389 RepID=UPI0024C24FF6|nr:hypothetical protein [Halomicroarcula sp. YJ-61-S]